MLRVQGKVDDTGKEGVSTIRFHVQPQPRAVGTTDRERSGVIGDERDRIIVLTQVLSVRGILFLECVIPAGEELVFQELAYRRLIVSHISRRNKGEWIAELQVGVQVTQVLAEPVVLGLELLLSHLPTGKQKSKNYFTAPKKAFKEGISLLRRERDMG